MPDAAHRCPFCSGTVTVASRISGRSWIECVTCHARGPSAKSEADAVERWNLGLARNSEVAP